ncbi:MAG: hypothetical protein HY241_14000 [Actinobacteria bacterium]|nr:hypothetical protein [Actinomycetota bacterium]
METTDEFLLGVLDGRPAVVMQAVVDVAARTGRHGPARTAVEIAELLGGRNTPVFGATLAKLLAARS